MKYIGSTNIHPGPKNGVRSVRHLTLSKKRSILLNNIFGVDIDSQAIEVCNLSLYLRLLQEETTDTAHQYLIEYEHVAKLKQLLPDLSGNILCGNSLIEHDILDGTLFSDTYERRLNPFSYRDAFPAVMRDGGFDAIIGNPPYQLIQNTNRDNIQLDYFKSHYTVARYKIDLYHLFIERAISLTKPGGYCSMITPSNFLTNNHLGELRRLLLNKTAISDIMVLDGTVFRDVSVDNAIFRLRVGLPSPNTFVLSHATVSNSLLSNTEERHISVPATLQNARALFTNHRDSLKSAVLETIYRNSAGLSSIASVNFGKQLRNRDIYTQDVIQLTNPDKIPKGYRRCYTGRDVSRYSLSWGGLACLDSREARRGGCWDSDMHNAKNKLLTRQIGKYPEFALDTEGYQCLNTIFMVNLHNDEYSPQLLLGILNSSLIRFLWLEQYYDQRRTFPKIKGTYLNDLPIRKMLHNSNVWRDTTSSIERHVDNLIQGLLRQSSAVSDKERQYFSNKTAVLERQIDELVCEVYGLSAPQAILISEMVNSYP